MSEEQSVNQVDEKKETSCKIVLLIILTVISLLFSVSSLVLSIIVFKGGAHAPAGQQAAIGKDAISKKYDKGRSLDKALNTGKPVLVFFYTDWCGFCQRFAPTFDKITKDAKIKKEFAIAYVNCEDSKNQKHVEDYEVQGYPTVFVIKTDGTRKQLENNKFFNSDSVEVVTKDALDAIGE